MQNELDSSLLFLKPIRFFNIQLSKPSAALHRLLQFSTRAQNQGKRDKKPPQPHSVKTKDFTSLSAAINLTFQDFKIFWKEVMNFN